MIKSLIFKSGILSMFLIERKGRESYYHCWSSTLFWNALSNVFKSKNKRCIYFEEKGKALSYFLFK